MSKVDQAISGVILAGGRSRRMGQAKENLLLNGRRLIDITLEALRPFFKEILIVTDNKSRFTELKGAEAVEDLVNGCGPLGGIYTGLKAISNQQGFFVACDMPFLRKELIQRLLEISKQEDCDALVPRALGRAQPLHAVYSKNNLPIITGLLKGDEFAISELLARCKCRYVEVDRQEEAAFFNLNSLPVILAVIGKSDSGKTTLILRLLPELKSRGYKVAVAKHCPRGFDLDLEGKDSFRFSQAGSDGTYLSSDKDIALIRPRAGSADLKTSLQNYFLDFDFVLLEGYHNASEIDKVQIIRSGIGEMDAPVDGIVAYLSDLPLSKDKPVYKLDDISGIVSFVEGLKKN